MSRGPNPPVTPGPSCSLGPQIKSSTARPRPAPLEDINSPSVFQDGQNLRPNNAQKINGHVSPPKDTNFESEAMSNASFGQGGHWLSQIDSKLDQLLLQVNCVLDSLGLLRQPGHTPKALRKPWATVDVGALPLRRNEDSEDREGPAATVKFGSRISEVPPDSPVADECAEVLMDDILTDTRILAQSLGERQRLADDQTPRTLSPRYVPKRASQDDAYKIPEEASFDVDAMGFSPLETKISGNQLTSNHRASHHRASPQTYGALNIPTWMDLQNMEQLRNGRRMSGRRRISKDEHNHKNSGSMVSSEAFFKPCFTGNSAADSLRSQQLHNQNNVVRHTPSQEASARSLDRSGHHKDSAVMFESEVDTYGGTDSQSTPGTTAGSLRAVLSDPMGTPIKAMLQKQRHRGRLARAIWLCMEDRDSSRRAQWYARLMPIFILITVAFSLMQTAREEDQPLQEGASSTTEIVFESIFLIELCLRYIVCSNLVAFFLSPFNMIDLLATVPLPLRLAMGIRPPRVDTLEYYFLSCAVPVIRLLKTLRHFRNFILLSEAFMLALEALPVLLFTLALLTLVFSSIIYIIEPRDNIDTLPKAIWMTIVTMTTVGYGDTVPKSVAGTVVTCVLLVTGVMYMAIPLGMLGDAFTKIWSQRHKILLLQRTRVCLAQWGYTPFDIPHLFEQFDGDGDHELNIDEFRELFMEMNVGLSSARVNQLFDTFDVDCSGFVSDKELVRMVFPNQFHDVFSPKRKRTGGRGASTWTNINMWGHALSGIFNNSQSQNNPEMSGTASEMQAEPSVNRSWETDPRSFQASSQDQTVGIRRQTSSEQSRPTTHTADSTSIFNSEHERDQSENVSHQDIAL